MWELSYNLKIVTATSNFRGQRVEEEREPNRIRIQKTELDISDLVVVLDNMDFSAYSIQLRRFQLHVV